MQIGNETNSSSRRSKFRSIGIDLNSPTINSPLKSLLSNIKSGESSNNTSQIDPIMQNQDFDKSIYNESLSSIQLNDKNLDDLFDQQTQLNDTILSKFNELTQIHNELGILIDGIETNNYTNITTQPGDFLPTPTSDDNDDKYKNDDVNKRYSEIKSQSNLSRDFMDIPSSPESFGSNTSQLEIELNEKISRFAQLQNDNRDVLKLKNVINSTLDLIRFEINDEDDGKFKLMNYNDDIHDKSQLLLDRLSNLVSTFTV